MIAKNYPLLKWILITLLLLWIFAVTGIFYVVQKPFVPASLVAWWQGDAPAFAFSAAALGRTLLNALTALWLWAMALGVGMWGIRGLEIRDWRLKNANALQSPISNLQSLETIVLGSGLGFGAVGLLIFFLGLTGLITKPVFYGTATILTLIALPQLVALTRSPAHRLTGSPAHRLTRSLAHPLTLLYLALTLALGFTLALLPPTDWDGLFYHLTGPKLYIAAEGIKSGIDIPHLSFPGLFEMNYMMAMLLRGDVSAKLLHFIFALLLAGLVYLTAARLLNLKNSWLAVLFLFSMPMVLTLASWTYNDLALAFYQLAALYALLRWRFETERQGEGGTRRGGDKERRGQGEAKKRPSTHRPTRSPAHLLILGGVFCGLAMGLKYTSVVAPVTLGVLLLWNSWQQRYSLRRATGVVLRFALPALLVAAPWYVKNRFFTGNPVYPFVFDGIFWDEFRAAAYSGAGSGIGFDLFKLIALPVNLTLGIYDANYSDGRSGILFLAFLPLLLAYGVFGYRKKSVPSAMRWLLFFALAQYAFWTLGVIWSAGLWQSRLLLPAFVALAPVMAWIVQDLAHLDHPQFSLHNFLSLFIGAVLLLGLVDQLFTVGDGWIYYRPYAHLWGTETRPEYLRRRLGAHYKAMEAINDQLPANAVIEFLWEPRSYYCQKACHPDSILDKYGHLQYLYGQNAAAIAQAWQDKGVTHVLVFKWGLDFLLDENTATNAPRPDPTVLEELKANYLEQVINVDGGYQIYQVK